MTDLGWVQKIIPKDVREHPTIAVIAIIFLIRGFVATPDDVQAVYRYWIKCNPQGTEITLQIAKNVSGTTTFSNVITANTNIPPTTQALKPVTALYTINAVARTIGSSTFHAAIPFKGFAS